MRVLSHEINNSLAPIKSIARSLQRVLKREPRAPDWEQEALHGLDVIEGRSGSLSRFLQAYARLAQLPKPVLRPVDVEGWVRRVVELEERMPVVVCPGPPTTILADRDQLDQLLINIVRNAVDAASDTGGGVRVSWTSDETSVVVLVEDEGPGLATRRTSSCRSSRRSRKARGSGLRSAGRSPRRTGGRSRSRTGRIGPARGPGYGFRFGWTLRPNAGGTVGSQPTSITPQRPMRMASAAS